VQRPESGRRQPHSCPTNDEEVRAATGLIWCHQDDHPAGAGCPIRSVGGCRHYFGQLTVKRDGVKVTFRDVTADGWSSYAAAFQDAWDCTPSGCGWVRMSNDETADGWVDHGRAAPRYTRATASARVHRVPAAATVLARLDASLGDS
jgi:hypothetical protein